MIQIYNLVVLLLISTCLCHPVPEQKVRFDRHRVIRVVPTTAAELSSLVSLHDMEMDGVDFWRDPTHTFENVDIHLSPSVLHNATDFLTKQGLKYKVLINNIQDLIDDEDRHRHHMRHKRSTNSFENYMTYFEAMRWLDNLAAGCQYCQLQVIGQSYEGKDLALLKIGKWGINKPAIWIDGGAHAREWIAPATAMFIADKLANSGNDVEVESLLNTFDFYILPLNNPDGYEYTFQHNRLWRKTRSRHEGSQHCRGADPNRNWNFHWAERGSSHNPCAETYHGAKTFSEPETAAVSNKILSLGGKVKVYFSLHSYGQMWLTPWGYTHDLPEDYDELKEKAEVGAAALRAVHGTTYVIGTSTRILYSSAGGSDDWAKGVANVKYAYTIELRDSGDYGFNLPASQIIPTGEETWAGIKALATAVEGEFRTK